MRTLFRSRVLGATLLALALVAAACSSGDDAQTDTTTTTATPTDSIADTTTTSGDPGPPTREGTLRIAWQPIVQTDPAFISSDPEVGIANAVYDYLVDVTADNAIEPRLATSWSASDDGLTWVFELADGATFHDGSAFSAADVVWTFNRLRDETVGAATVSLYENITDITASGPLEVTFTLASPNPFLPFDLSDNHALVVKDGTTDASDFNGTGPFKLVNYSPEDRVELEANESYFIEGLPKLAGVEFIFFADAQAPVDAVRDGQVDMALRMPTDGFTTLQGVDGVTTSQIPTNGFDLVRLRSDTFPGDDPRVMQALKHATDRQAIFQTVSQGLGAIGRDTPIGPLYTDLYTEEFEVPALDLDRARELLAEAGLADGFSIDMHTPDTGDRPDLAVALKDQWSQIGVDVNVLVEPESVYYGENGWLDVDLGITSWGSRPYPQFYLDVMLVCGAKWNESHFCDAEFDALAGTSGSSLDPAERAAAYKDMQRILNERGPILIPYFFPQFGALSNDFVGLDLKAFAGRTDLRIIELAG